MDETIKEVCTKYIVVALRRLVNCTKDNRINSSWQAIRLDYEPLAFYVGIAQLASVTRQNSIVC